MAVWILYRKLGVFLGVLYLLLLLSSVSASAHAYVVATSPGVNASVASPPQEIVVVYDEPVGIDGPAAVVVRGKDGATYPCSIAHASERVPRVACTLSTRLKAGSYTVSWRVTSADGHIVQGEFSFGVGVSVYGFVDELQAGVLRSWTSTREALRGLSDEPVYLLSTPAAFALRWLTLFGVALLVGALGFEWFVLGWRAFEASLAAAVLRRWCRRLSIAGAVLTLFASLAALLLPTVLITQSDSANEAWLVRVGLLCIVLVAMRSRRFAPLAYVAAALIPVCLSLSANAAEGGHQADGVLDYATDWLHVSAASLYVGGLVVFAATIRPALAAARPEERPGFLRDVIAAFSRLAIVCVAAITGSGVYAGVAHVGSFSRLFGTLYGQVILAKVFLLTLLVAFGYFHLRQGRGRSDGHRFVTTVSGEAAIAVAILGLAAILVGLSPPA